MGQSTVARGLGADVLALCHDLRNPLGQVAGIAVNQKNGHVLLVHRPGTLLPDEWNAKEGKPVTHRCCRTAPAVIEYDAAGNYVRGWTPTFRCLLTQTTRGTVIAKHIREEILRAGFTLIESEMLHRVTYPETALFGATPSMIDPEGAAARDITAIADEIDSILSVRQAVRA